MGKNITSQKRGKGSPTFIRPSFRFQGPTKIGKDGNPTIFEIISCQGHSAPLIRLQYNDNSYALMIAPQGVRIGQQITIGQASPEVGNVLKLKDIPEGTEVYNIENTPGDGGKFVRASGMSAKIVGKSGGRVTLLLPSKKTKDFNSDCRACIGIVAGGGRPEKPFYKAGRKYHRMRAKNIYWPIVCGSSMNAVDHPFGGRSSHHKGKPTIAPHNAPPGKKAGAIRPRRTGKKR